MSDLHPMGYFFSMIRLEVGGIRIFRGFQLVMGVPPVVIHCRLGISLKSTNQRTEGTPHDELETPTPNQLRNLPHLSALESKPGPGMTAK